MAQLRGHAHITNISVNRMGPVLNVPTTRNVLSLAINVLTEFVFAETYQVHAIQLAVIYVTQMMAMASACVGEMPSATQAFKT